MRVSNGADREHASNKQDKQIANRKLRHAVVQALRQGRELMPELREVSNNWNFGKEGR